MHEPVQNLHTTTKDISAQTMALSHVYVDMVLILLELAHRKEDKDMNELIPPYLGKTCGMLFTNVSAEQMQLVVHISNNTLGEHLADLADAIMPDFIKRALEGYTKFQGDFVEAKKTFSTIINLAKSSFVDKPQ